VKGKEVLKSYGGAMGVIEEKIDLWGRRIPEEDLLLETLRHCVRKKGRGRPIVCAEGEKNVFIRDSRVRG